MHIVAYNTYIYKTCRNIHKTPVIKLIQSYFYRFIQFTIQLFIVRKLTQYPYHLANVPEAV